MKKNLLVMILDSELKSNPDNGLVLNNDGSYEIMTYSDFMQRFNNNLSIVDGYDCWSLVERSRADSRIVHNRTRFETEEEAQDQLEQSLESRYNDDSGAGGVWYGTDIDDLEFDSEEIPNNISFKTPGSSGVLRLYFTTDCTMDDVLRIVQAEHPGAMPVGAMGSGHDGISVIYRKDGSFIGDDE